MPRLLSIPEAARELGVPKESLRRAADDHGMTIRVGRAVRLHPNDLEELIELCRVAPRVRASTGARQEQSGKSETAAPAFRPAQAAAQKLKARSQPTSPKKPAPVVPLDRRT